MDAKEAPCQATCKTGPSAFSMQPGCASWWRSSHERHAIPLGRSPVPCPSRCCPCFQPASSSIGWLLILSASSLPSVPAARRAPVPCAGARRAVSTADTPAASATCRGRAVSASSSCRSDASGARLPSARAASLPSACRVWPCHGCGARPALPRPSAALPSAQEARPAPAWRRGGHAGQRRHPAAPDPDGAVARGADPARDRHRRLGLAPCQLR